MSAKNNSHVEGEVVVISNVGEVSLIAPDGAIISIIQQASSSICFSSIAVFPEPSVHVTEYVYSPSFAE